MAQITHSTIVVQPNNPADPVSANAWNASHTITANAYSLIGNSTSALAAASDVQYPVLGTPSYTTSGFNLLQITANSNTFAQISIQNTNSGSSASSDFVATADDGTDSTHYIDMGINNSTGGAAAFTNAHAGYLYVVDNELDIGALGASGTINFYTTGGVGSPVLAGSFSATQGFSVVGHTTFEGVTSAGATGTGNLVYSASPTLTGTLTASAITASGIVTLSQAGASSASAVAITGTPFAGSTTTSTPLAYLNNAVTQPTTWSANSTYFGINAISGFIGNFIDLHNNGGASLFSISSGGSITTSGSINTTKAGAASTSAVFISGSFFSGGNGTTTFPLVYIDDGTAPSSWNTSGTIIGINTPSAFAGNLLDFHKNGGASVFSLSIAGTPTTLSGVATAGLGVPSIYGYGRATAQVAANASVSTYTVGASDGSFDIVANVLVTTSTLHNFTVTCSYTDEGNTARVLTLQFSNLAGTFLTAIANAAGAVPYEGVAVSIRAKAASTITISSAAGGTYTTVVYNIEGFITQKA